MEKDETSMSTELVKFEKPQLPENWNYEESLLKTKQLIYQN